MRFKGTFTDRGVKTLSKAFLPTLEKFGKTCQLLISTEELHIVQTSVDTDGPYVTARFTVGVLFSEDSYLVKSRHYNLAAFSVDLAMLLKVLSSAHVHDAEVLEVKLMQKPVPVPGSDEPQGKPFLNFLARGHSLNLMQDLPISSPYRPNEIDNLARVKDVASLCDFYLDLAAAAHRLQAVLERMRPLGSTITFALCKNGDLHLQVSATNAMLGTQFQGLGVYPPDVVGAAANRETTAEEQLQAAIATGEALQVQLQLKHLLKVLSTSQMTQPAQILCGIAANRGHVHVMYAYKNPNSTDPFDDSLGLNFKLPVREDD